MPELLLISVGYGSYISIIKFVIFLLLFFLWLPLISWIHEDAKVTGLNTVMWTSIVLTVTVFTTILWLVIPVFIVGMLLYVIAVGIASLSYISHRNSAVLEFERVLTAEHIKSLFSSGGSKKLESLKDFSFITANNNEIPMPRPKTPDFFGYRIAYDVFTDATWRRAEKILFSPDRENYSVTYYIDGAGLKQPSMSREQMEYFVPFIKSLADLDIKEKRKPQKSTFSIFRENKSTEWEIVTAGSTAGEQIQFKQRTKWDITGLADIGLTDEQQIELEKIQSSGKGLYIVTGPAKSGVTTTFYALLRNHDAFLNSISVLEKQSAMELPNITQETFTLSDSGTSKYSTRLQSIVRMGPDIVGTADCEDGDTAQVACQAAKDGRIVYVTMEAENVIQAISKWIKMVGDKNKAIESLIGVSNQRLIRQLCSECKQGYRPNQELLRKFNLPAEKAKVLYRPGKVVYDKHGKETICENCQGTGFVGRTGIFETVTISGQLREGIKQAKSMQDIGTQFRQAKMLYLQEQALKKVISGTTAVNEMIRIFSKSQSQKSK